MGSRTGPLVSAGVLLGAGLGGFADGILFHQILQWHNMLSARIPPDNLVDVKVNMVWDGLFHAAVWLMTLGGVGLLFRAGRGREVFWSGKAFAGAMLVGWGLFNLIEGVVDHHVLGLHHVMEYGAHRLAADLVFLAVGLGLLLAGARLIRNARR